MKIGDIVVSKKTEEVYEVADVLVDKVVCYKYGRYSRPSRFKPESLAKPKQVKGRRKLRKGKAYTEYPDTDELRRQRDWRREEERVRLFVSF